MTTETKIDLLLEITNLDIFSLAEAIGAQRYDLEQANRGEVEHFPTTDLGSKVEMFLKKLGYCPDCCEKLWPGGGCAFCPVCGYSECL